MIKTDRYNKTFSFRNRAIASMILATLIWSPHAYSRVLYHYKTPLKMPCNYLEMSSRQDPAATRVKKVEQEVLIREIKDLNYKTCQVMKGYMISLTVRTMLGAATKSSKSYKRIAAAVSCVNPKNGRDDVHLLECTDENAGGQKKVFTIDFYAKD